MVHECNTTYQSVMATSVTYLHSYMSSFLLNHHYQTVIHGIYQIGDCVGAYIFTCCLSGTSEF